MNLGLVCINHASAVKVKKGESLLVCSTGADDMETWEINWKGLQCLEAVEAGLYPCRIWACLADPRSPGGHGQIIFKNPATEA